jgi:Leucine-rich repeat (LRR) protein
VKKVYLSVSLWALLVSTAGLSCPQTIEEAFQQLPPSNSSSKSNLPHSDERYSHQQLIRQILSAPGIAAEKDVVYDTKLFMQGLLDKAPEALNNELKIVISHLCPPEDLIYWPKASGQLAVLEPTLSEESLLFKRIKELQKEILTLKAQSSAYPSLQNHLEQLNHFYQRYIDQLCAAPLAERGKLFERKVRMSGDKLGVYRISQDIAWQMISRSIFNKRERQGQAFGQHDVRPLGGIHFKRLASLSLQHEGESAPGIEHAVYSLSRILGYSILSPTMVVVLDGVKTLTLPEVEEVADDEQPRYQTLRKQLTHHELMGKDLEQVLATDLNLKGLERYFRYTYQPHVLQASLTVDGINVQEFFEQDKNNIQKINPENFQQHFSLSLITHLEDVKFDNFIAEEHAQLEEGTKASDKDIIGIDSDHAFTDAIVMTGPGRHYPNVRNFFYCLETYMNQPFSEKLRHFFREQPPLALAFKWLQELEAQNQRYQLLCQRHLNLLAEHETSQELTKLVYGFHQIFDKQLGLPIKLVPGTLRAVYQKLEHLHNLCCQEEELLTPHLLLRKIDPLVGAYYQYLRQHFPDDPFAMLQVLYQTGEDIPLETALVDFCPTPQELTKVLAPYTAGPFDYENNRTQTLVEARSELIELVLQRGHSFGYLMQKRVPTHALSSLIAANVNLNQKDNEGNTPVHLAILHMQHDVQQGLGYLRALLKAGADAKVLNQNYQTPLDLALEHHLVDAVVELVEAGFGNKLNARTAEKFYHALHKTFAWTSRMEETWQHLETFNPELRWRIAKNTLFKEEPKELEAVTYGTGSLHRDISQKLMLEKSFKEAIGRYCYSVQTCPPLPGLQYAISRFLQLTVKTGVTPYELFRVFAPKKGEPIGVSLPWSGQSLGSVIESHPVLLSQLDTDQTAAVLLMSMLLQLHIPELEAYQMYLSVTSPSAYQISLTKASSAFKENGFSILYCLDQMLLPLTSTFRTQMRSIEASTLLRTWLDDLKQYQQRVQTIFNMPEQVHYQLHMPLPHGIASQLYSRLSTLQELLKQDGITPLDILLNLSPSTGHLFQRLFELYPNPQSFRARMVELKKRPLDNPLLQMPFEEPTAALQQLSTLIDPHQEAQQAQHGLKQGNLETYLKLTPEWKYKTVAQVDTAHLSPSLQRNIFKNLPAYPLTILSLHHLEDLKDKVLQKLLKNAGQVQHLELIHLPAITSDSLRKLDEALPQLEKLMVQNTAIKELTKPQGFSGTKPLLFKRLTHLDLSFNSHLQKVKIEAPLLTEASFKGCSSLGLSTLGLQAPSLAHLSVEKCPQMTSQDVENFKQKYPALKSLNIAGTSLPYAALRSVDFAYPYELLRGENSRFETSLIKLLQNESQQSDLSSLGLEDTDIPALVAALAKNTILTELDLQNNKISSQRLQGLVQVLHRIKGFDLSCNEIDGEGIPALSDLIRYYMLESLSLNNNPVGTDGILKLGEGFTLNCSLTSLSLRECMIRPRAANALKHILTHAVGLKRLDLGRNLIRDEGAQALAEGLKGHKALTDLNVHKNQIEVSGGQALAAAIAENTHLLYVDINSNNITSEAQKSIEASLKRNKMLHSQSKR